jgi:hypothetical protein
MIKLIAGLVRLAWRPVTTLALLTALVAVSHMALPGLSLAE